MTSSMVLAANWPQLFLNGIVIGSGYVLLAMGLNLVFGILDIADFAQGNLYMLSAYLLFFFAVSLGLPFWVSGLAAILVTSLVGVGFYLLVYRYLVDEPPITTFLAAFGLFAFLEGLVFLVWGPANRNIPSPVPGRQEALGLLISNQRLISIIVTAIVILFTFYIINRTHIGLNMRAIAQNRLKASLLGVNAQLTFVMTFFIASALSATGGVIVGSVFSISPFIGLEAILKGFIVAIFGGLGSVRGAVVAGYLLGLSEAFSVVFVSAEVANNVGFVILFMVLIFMPHGIFGREEVAA